MILYYCRFATRPVLLQLYQTEVGRGLSPDWPGKREMALPVLLARSCLCGTGGVTHAAEAELCPLCPLAVYGAVADAPGSGTESSSCPDHEVPRAVFHPCTVPSGTKQCLTVLPGFPHHWNLSQTKPLHEGSFHTLLCAWGRCAGEGSVWGCNPCFGAVAGNHLQQGLVSRAA